MSAGTFVLAVVGESPAVLTELLWWLGVVEAEPVAGVEVWTTSGGRARLLELIHDHELWSAFQRAAGRLPSVVADGEPSSAFGFRLHVFSDEEGTELADVRTKRESGVVSATLHDRVRRIRDELGGGIRLLASLAGGRKTVSAALQSAMCLQAGRQDRLVHVLLADELERKLRHERRLHTYLYPTASWAEDTGVAEADQVVVYDVPFPRVRHLVSWRLARALQECDYDDVWSALDANMPRTPVARLYRPGLELWRYEVRDAGTGEVLFREDLGKRHGALLAAVALTPPGSGQKELLDWLDEADVGWAPPGKKGAHGKARLGQVRTGVSEVRGMLRKMEPGLECCMVSEQGFDLDGVEVDLVPKVEG